MSEVLTEELIRIKEFGMRWNAEQREVAIMKGLITAEDLVDELNREENRF